MMKQYSFADESTNVSGRQKQRRNWHVPQSRADAQFGTIGSYASITSKYNNVYKRNNDLDANDNNF